MEITETEKQKENRIKKIEESLRDYGIPLSEHMRLMGVPEGEERADSLFKEIMTTSFPSLMNEIDIQIQNAQLQSG